MTDHYDIFYSEEALNDLSNIYTYIAYELLAEQTATDQVNRIRKRIRELDTFPEGYGLVEWEPWHSMGMRKLPVDNYVIYFMADRDTATVDIVRIFYGGRDIAAMVNELH